MTTQTETIFHTIQAPRVVTEQRMRDLLCTAFEGGATNHWAYQIDSELRDGLTIEDFRTNPDDTTQQGSEAARLAPGEYHPSYQLVPFSEGCVLTILDTEEVDDRNLPIKYRMDRDSMKRALDLMAEKYPRHFNDFMEENDDANTGDVFLQLAYIGEVIYG